jgi:hypothetical protein
MSISIIIRHILQQSRVEFYLFTANNLWIKNYKMYKNIGYFIIFLYYYKMGKNKF